MLYEVITKYSDGFPGWHLECSAMSAKYLGEEFDIHGGGMDLLFPHHECEIAQSTIANEKSPAKYWMHNNMITINGQKMGKSLGNFITLEELFTVITSYSIHYTKLYESCRMRLRLPRGRYHIRGSSLTEYFHRKDRPPSTELRFDRHLDKMLRMYRVLQGDVLSSHQRMYESRGPY